MIKHQPFFTSISARTQGIERYISRLSINCINKENMHLLTTAEWHFLVCKYLEWMFSDGRYNMALPLAVSHFLGYSGISNHQHQDCLLNRLFRCRPKKTLTLRVTGLCAGNSPVPGEFHAQVASNAENDSIWWRHHDNPLKNHNSHNDISVKDVHIYKQRYWTFSYMNNN